MASFVFESGTQTQASGFLSSDTLVFQSALPTQLAITLGTAQFGTPTVTIAQGTQSLQFAQTALAGASTAGNIRFFNAQAGTLNIGDDTANTYGAAAAPLNVRGDSVFYTFGGADTVTIAATNAAGNANSGSALVYLGTGADTFTSSGSGIYTVFGEAGNDTINVSGSAANTSGIFGSFLNGGVGDDTITGSNGNDHIYGNASGSVQGTSDGADSILAGDGSDYVNGNAGADYIDGGAGSDRLFGGAAADTIFGGTGNDTVNGNQGNDTIVGGAGSDVLRGGQGNDVLVAQDPFGAAPDDTLGLDILRGDAGADTLAAGSNLDVLEGGADNDTFFFSSGSAGYATTGTNAFQTDVISDYTDGTDKIALDQNVEGILRATGVTFTSVSAAATYAQQLLTNAGDDAATRVVALNVGNDAYLFYGDSVTGATEGSSVPGSAIHLLGVDSSAVSVSDFINSVG